MDHLLRLRRGEHILMKNIEKILEYIESDAREKIEQINKARDEEIEQIRQDAEYKAGDIAKKAENDALREYQQTIDRAASSGEMISKDIMLEAKTGLIEKVYADAEKFINSLPDDKYTEVMSRFLAEAVIERMQTVREMNEVYRDEEFKEDLNMSFEVIMSEADRESPRKNIISGAEKNIALRDMYVPKIRLSKKTADISGGFIVAYGNSETNCSTAVLVKAARERTYSKVAGILFK